MSISLGCLKLGALTVPASPTNCSFSSAAPRCFKAKLQTKGQTQEAFPQQYFLHLSAAALPPTLPSRECLNFLLRGRAVLSVLIAKATRKTGQLLQTALEAWAGQKLRMLWQVPFSPAPQNTHQPVSGLSGVLGSCCCFPVITNFMACKCDFPSSQLQSQQLLTEHG